ncbi:MAG TPA: class I SAM-dependent methyltransferase [Chthoniobacterales bacterium]|nr:class I SAM-dependent methyltransferase [Chthoniobacterales bacterium]
MSVYGGRYAELYDLFYSDKPYSEEAAFVHDCLQKFARAPVRETLELACGTGRHAIELEKFGYQITATDRSPDMLEIARRRAAMNHSKIVFALADMRTLKMPAKDYDAVVCLFDSIGYLKTAEALHEAFGNIREHLRPNGLLIFEFWHAAAMMDQYSPVRVRRWKTSKSEIVRISETTLDRKNRWAVVDYTVYQLNDNGTYSTLRETHTNRYFAVDEMRTLVSSAKLEPLKFFAGFENDERITDDTWHVVAVARKT